jgi:DNA segregation ATPase FtsK/SpoIIIE-like protein
MPRRQALYRHVVGRHLPDDDRLHESRVAGLVRARLAGAEINIGSEISRLREEISGRLPRQHPAPSRPPAARERAATPGVASSSTPPVPAPPASEPVRKAASSPSTDNNKASADAHIPESEDLEGPALLRRVLGALRVRVLEVEVGHVQDARRGTRYLVRVAPNVKLAQLQARAADIGRAMRSMSAPLIENIPGDDRINIEFLARGAEALPLWPTIDELPTAAPGTLPALLGVDTSGRPIVQDLAIAPHMVVAGSSGTGKSTLLYQMLVSLAARVPSSDLELLLVDPKATDFAIFRGLPHLNGRPILTDPVDVIEAVEELLNSEFPSRTRALLDTGHVSVAEMNREAGKAVVRPIVIVMEEFADIVDALESRQERPAFLRSLTRIGQRARSVAIHVVLTTQRPSKEILPPRLTANFPVRVCLQVPQLSDSIVVLGHPGAERLQGRGDLLVRRDGELLRGRALYAPRSELSAFVDRMKDSAS